MRWYRSPSDGTIDHELIWGGLCLALLALAWLVEPGDWPARLMTCAMRDWLGLPCPLCGGTRAWHALMHGEWGAAWGFNPLAMLMGLGAIAFVIYAAVAITSGRRWRPRRPVTRGWLASGFLAGLGATLITWIYLLTR